MKTLLPPDTNLKYGALTSTKTIPQEPRRCSLLKSTKTLLHPYRRKDALSHDRAKTPAYPEGHSKRRSLLVTPKSRSLLSARNLACDAFLGQCDLGPRLNNIRTSGAHL